jgi:hypothetical protein
MLERLVGVFLGDSGKAELILEPAPAIATAAKRLRLGKCISCIIDIAELAKAACKPVNVRFTSFAPPPLPDLA